ncbi:FecCD family ABC transporter permease [Limimaricola soesokkakensis]|uniref:FecCD family ABC transporter permease n=1 Tax=Limimaricola soesokkakensis TaxID=1343159 RepID=UPI003511A9F1
MRWRRAALPALAAAALLCGGALSLSTGGRSDVGLADISGMFAGAEATLAQQTMRDIRVPRTLTAVFLGINLGLAGLILQAITRNALAAPGLLGINQGAALGIVLGLLVPSLSGVPQPLLATLFGLVAITATFAISGAFTGRIDSLRLILGGIAVGALGFAAVRLGYTLEDDLARQVVRWTVGDIGGVRLPEAARLGTTALLGSLAALAMAQRLNLMALGQAASHGLGADPRRTLLIGAGVASALTSVCVSVAGPIAFAGLVVPHLAKALTGADHRKLVPVTAALGAGLMAWADAGSKLWPGFAEIPIGVVVSMIGAPWFLVIVLMRKGQARG